MKPHYQLSSMYGARKVWEKTGELGAFFSISTSCHMEISSINCTITSILRCTIWIKMSNFNSRTKFIYSLACLTLNSITVTMLLNVCANMIYFIILDYIYLFISFISSHRNVGSLIIGQNKDKPFSKKYWTKHEIQKNAIYFVSLENNQ